jgi:hypothetical protein
LIIRPSFVAINPYSFALFSVLAQQPAEAGNRRRARPLTVALLTAEALEVLLH